MSMFFDKSKSRAYAKFRIWSEQMNPEDITKKLDIIPTESEEKGKYNERTGKPYVISSWEYQTEEQSTFDLSERLDDLITVLKPKRNELVKIRELFPEDTFAIDIVLYNHHNFLPGMAFSNEQLLFTADIGVSLEISIYQL